MVAFPGALDAFVDPAANTRLTGPGSIPHHLQHSNLNDIMAEVEKILVGRPWVNAMSSGAKGDGVTNDGPVIQTLIDNLSAAGGGTLFIPETTIAVGSVGGNPGLRPKTGVVMMGAGRGSRIKRIDNDIAGTRLIGTPAGNSTLVDTTDTWFLNFYIDGNSANNDPGGGGTKDDNHNLFLSNVKNVLIAGIESANAGSDAIYLHGGTALDGTNGYCDGAVLVHNEIHDPIRVGANLHGAIGSVAALNNFHDIPNWAMKMELDNHNHNRYGNRILGNVCRRVAGGFSASGAANTTTTITSVCSTGDVHIDIDVIDGGLSAAPCAGETYRIDPDTEVEEWIVVSSVSGTGPYTITAVNPLGFGHAIGATVLCGYVTGILVADNTFDLIGTPGTAGNAVLFNTIARSRVARNRIRGAKSEAVNLSRDCIFNSVSDNEVSDLVPATSGTHGALTVGGGSGRPCEDNTVERNKLYNVPGLGLYTLATIGGSGGSVLRNHFIENDVISSLDNGMLLSGSDDCEIKGNRFRNNGKAGDNAAIIFKGTNLRPEMVDNKFYGTSRLTKAVLYNAANSATDPTFARNMLLNVATPIVNPGNIAGTPYYWGNRRLGTTGAMPTATNQAFTIGGVQFFGGSGAPNNADGNNGDFYFNMAGGAGTTIYQRLAGAWVGIV